MSASFRKAGIKNVEIEWRNADDLPSIIDSQVQSFLDRGMSLLVVSVMSHGTAGLIHGTEESRIGINSLLCSLAAKLPKFLPLVSVIRYK